MLGIHVPVSSVGKATRGLGRMEPSGGLSCSPLSDLDIQPLDLLIQRRKRNPQSLGCRRLAPVGGLQLLDDLAALIIRDDLKERSVGRKAAALIAPATQT